MLALFSVAYSIYSIYILYNFISLIMNWFDSSRLGDIFIGGLFVFAVILPIIAGIGVWLNKKWPLTLYWISFVVAVVIIIFIKLFISVITPGYVFPLLNLIMIILLSMQQKTITHSSPDA